MAEPAVPPLDREPFDSAHSHEPVEWLMAEGLDGRGEFSSPSAARAILAAALLLGLVFAFWDLDFPLQGSEGRWAMVSREMASSHNLFSMTIGGRPYDDKPFGSYWLILLASKFTGSMSEFTLRLPSVTSYLLTVLLVYAIGRRTAGSPATAALAAFIYATMFRILYFSREASADAQTVLGIAAALLLVLEAGEKPRWFIFPLIGLVMGLSSLMKGLSGFAAPCFAAFLWCLLVRGFRWLRPIPGAAAGIVVFAATLGAPLLIAHARQGGWHPVERLWRESVGRAVSPSDHREPLYFYLWNQFELLSPWSVFLPAAIGLWIVAHSRAGREARRLGAVDVRPGSGSPAAVPVLLLCGDFPVLHALRLAADVLPDAGGAVRQPWRWRRRCSRICRHGRACSSASCSGFLPSR